MGENMKFLMLMVFDVVVLGLPPDPDPDPQPVTARAKLSSTPNATTIVRARRIAAPLLVT
jgi:hypothetical protein